MVTRTAAIAALTLVEPDKVAGSLLVNGPSLIIGSLWASGACVANKMGC